MTNHATRLSKNALQMPKKSNKTITSIMVLCTNSPLIFYQHTLFTILYAFQISASTLTVATCEPSFALGSCLMLTPIIPRRNLVVSCPFHLLYHFHRDLRANAYTTSRDRSGVHCGGPNAAICTLEQREILQIAPPSYQDTRSCRAFRNYFAPRPPFLGSLSNATRTYKPQSRMA